MTKKRVAILLHGGIGTGHFAQGVPMLHRIVERLCERYEVDIFSQSQPAGPVSSLRIFSPDSSSKSSSPRWLKLISMLRKQHGASPYQVLLSFWGYPAGVICSALSKYLGIPSILYLLGGDTAGIKSIRYGIMNDPFKRFLAKWAYNSASTVFVLSSFQKDQLSRVGITRTVKVIPWGIDLDAYAYRERLPKERTVRFIHVGHLTPVKDQHTLLETFAIINQRMEASLSILGVDAGLKGSLINHCDRLNIKEKVTFHDMVPYAEMPTHYDAADILLHTSVSEGQALVVNEAAACGVLVGGTKVGIIYDLSDRECIRVEVGQHEELADQVCHVLNNPELWLGKIRAARKWSESHDLRWTVDQIISEVENVTKK